MNPAIPLLLRCYGASRLRRMRDAFSTSRRTILMLAAIALGMIWLGQTIASVLFREPYPPESFHRWTSLILAAYFCWHFIRVAYKRPDCAIEWSAAEAAQIAGGPFRRRDVLIYRFLIILTSTIPKALLTAFVLLPDLWWSGLPGIVLALVFLESFRMAIDVGVCCLSERGYQIARTAVFGIVMVAVFSIVWRTGAIEVSNNQTRFRGFSDIAATAGSLRDSTAGWLVERPFVVFADVITAQEPSLALATNILAATAMVGGILLTIGWLDRRHEMLIVNGERSGSGLSTDSDVDRLTGDPPAAGSEMPESHGCDGTSVPRLPHIPRLATSGPIVWRQLKSAGRYRGSLLVAVGIPAVLSCLPLFSVRDATYAFLALVATVVFYSFVLLPEAIKFDFRLDCDHLTQLKVLPISSFRLVAGQLAVPVLVSTLFQTSLYLLAGIARPVSPILVASAILLTVPINVLFVAIDNLIFLLYPHRPTQEGFEAFVRTILKFTFKSVLLGVASGFVLFWALSSRYLVDVGGGVPDQVRLIFIGGLCLAAWVTAALSLVAVTRAFERFDVSVSVPA